MLETIKNNPIRTLTIIGVILMAVQPEISTRLPETSFWIGVVEKAIQALAGAFVVKNIYQEKKNG